MATQYIQTIGRRKTSTARIRLTPGGKNSFVVNDKPVDEYFKTPELARVAKEALFTGDDAKEYTITVRVNGGGVHSQAQAIRHGIARALVAENEEVKPELKKSGFLKRDPRAKERRKFGFKKARKRAQWSKR